jgi:cation diffusion facilitator family transporter
VQKTRLILTASVVALAGNAALAVAKVIAGFASGSFAVIGDGIDSSVDAIISVMGIFVAHYVGQKPDKEHPYGHGRYETLATAVLGCLLFFAGAQLIESSVQRLFTGEALEIPDFAAVIVTVISIIGKGALAWSQYFFGKRTASQMLVANGKNMAADVILSVGVLLGLGITLFFHIQSADSIMAILVGAWVLKSAVGILLEVKTELMEKADPVVYRKVYEAAHTVEGVSNPHQARVRRIGGFYDIDLDIEVDGSKRVAEGHQIAQNVEHAIKKAIPDIVDLNVHVEPQGNKEEESYGLSEEDLT